MLLENSSIAKLINQLKEEGVAEIQKERALLITTAQNDAKLIISNAHTESAKIRHECKAQCEQERKALHSELTLATRDFLVDFSNHIATFIIYPGVYKHMSAVVSDIDFLKNTLRNILSNVVRNNNTNITVIMNENVKKDIITFFSQSILKDIQNNNVKLEFQDKFIGFKIVEKENKYVWDFTLESLTQKVSTFIEPYLLKYFIHV